MTETVRIGPENQITLSDEALARLGVKAGDQVDLVPRQDGGLEIRPKRLTLADMKGIVKLEKPVTAQELDRWVAEARGRDPQDETDR